MVKCKQRTERRSFLFWLKLLRHCGAKLALHAERLPATGVEGGGRVKNLFFRQLPPVMHSRMCGLHVAMHGYGAVTNHENRAGENQRTMSVLWQTQSAQTQIFRQAALVLFQFQAS